MARIRPFLGTTIGTVVAIVTIVIWMVTYGVHAGRDYAPNLFPLLCSILERNELYPPINIPMGAWYAGAFLHWFIFGVAADSLRCAIRFAGTRKSTRKSSADVLL
jgi:hypothetical protein